MPFSGVGRENKLTIGLPPHEWLGWALGSLMSQGAQGVVSARAVKSFAEAVERELMRAGRAGTAEVDATSPEVTTACELLRRALQAIKEEDAGDGVLFVPDDRTAALLMSFLAERLPAPGSTETHYETELASDDLAGWVTRFVPSWLKGRFNKHAFEMPDDVPTLMPVDFRLAILGDWGSGLYGAPVSASSIRSAVPRFDAVIHLGDVYYAGTPREVTERFLNLWPSIPGASSWALNSNHEMFSGGAGYFDTTLRDPRFALQRGSSCFAWENDHFVFLGLDTGYHDHDLGPEQGGWIRRCAAAAHDRKLVLFSHHQPFSAFDRQGTKLVEALRDLLEERRVVAWYWGHEHRCVFFGKHARWSTWGRCVGHGGYPQARDAFPTPADSVNADGSSWREVSREGVPDAWVLDGPNRYVVGHAEKYAPHGYVSLHFHGPMIHEAVHAPDGSLLLRHRIPEG